MAITYRGSASTPTATNGTNATSPIVVNPSTVGTMVAGDLVVVVVHSRTTADTHAVSATGGQTWNKLTTYSDATGLLTTVTYFWCRYNGTWGASPSFTHAGTCGTALMLVFIPTASANTWLRDVTEVTALFAAPTTPFDVTLTGITTAANSVAIGSFSSRDDNTWAVTSGFTLSRTINNLAGSDTGDLTGYKLMPSGGATGNFVGRETLLGGDTGVKYIVSFKEVTAYVLQTTTGTFTWTRNNAVELWNRLLKTTAGVFNWTGNDAILTYHQLQNYVLFTTTGSFVWTGNNALVTRGLKVLGSPGTFILTGLDVKLLRGLKTLVTAGVFNWTGQNAKLLNNRLIKASTGSFALDGKNAYLLVGHKLQTSTGVFIWTGLDAILTYFGGFTAYVLKTQTGVFDLTGSDQKLLWNRLLKTTPGSFVWTGLDVILTYGGALNNYVLWTTTGVFTLTGNNAILTWVSLYSPGTIIVYDGMIDNSSVNVTEQLFHQALLEDGTINNSSSTLADALFSQAILEDDMLNSATIGDTNNG